MDVEDESNPQTPKKRVDKIQTPHLGMTFETSSEARNYYEDYGKQEGFWVRTRSSYKSRPRSNEVTSTIFVCAHEGKYVSNKDQDIDCVDKEDIRMMGDQDEENNKEKIKKRRRSTIKGDSLAYKDQFFYAVHSDENGRAAIFFWVDARSRMSYHYFGDVVSFDTIYRTNKYDMPFAPFTGVNHHYLTIQFGCALLQDETEVTFTWLFETWLEAMGGRPPVSIITDQDLAMKAAISNVFPGTRHRLCYWHIKKKFVEKLSHLYYKNSVFKVNMKSCIWSTQS